MRRFIVIILAIFTVQAAGAQALPGKFEVKIKSKDHVQGMAIDTASHCFYLSFTTSLVKTDFDGNVLACIDSINGHLGAMTFDAGARKLYASLECKDDEIGRGIAKHLGTEAYTQDQSRFYVAVVDVDRMDSKDAMCTYEVAEAIADYKTRYGCSGIDGVTIALANDNAAYGRIPTEWTL